MAAVRQNGFAVRHASRRLRQDPEVAARAVALAGARALRHVGAARRADRALVLAAVRKGAHALKYASEELRADRWKPDSSCLLLHLSCE